MPAHIDWQRNPSLPKADFQSQRTGRELTMEFKEGEEAGSLDPDKFIT